MLRFFGDDAVLLFGAFSWVGLVFGSTHDATGVYEKCSGVKSLRTGIALVPSRVLEWCEGMSNDAKATGRTG